MKKIFFFFLCFFLLVSPSFAEIHSSHELTAVYYHVEGNKARSFYPANDADYLYEGSVDFKTPYKDYEAFGKIEYRSTNDRLVDVQDASLERFTSGLRAEIFEFVVGDFYSNFSEYSLGNALKGAKFSLGSEKTSRLTLVAGADFSKWEDLWERRCEDSQTRKYVWGARLENNLINNTLSLNFNYAGSRDDKAYTLSSAAPSKVNVLSTDFKYIVNQNVNISSELAESFVDEDIRSSSVDTKSDYAIKSAVDYNNQDYSCTTTFSRIGNHFATTGGFAAQDLQTINFDGLWFLPWKRIKFTHYLHTDRDNISNTKTTTTKQLNPGGKFSFNLPQDITIDVGSDLRKRYCTDKSTNSKTVTHALNLGKDFQIFYSSLGYTKSRVSDKINDASSRSTDTVSLGFDGNFPFRGVKCVWNIQEDINHDHYKQANKSDLSTTTTLGLKFDFPSSLQINLRGSFTDNDYYINETDSNIRNYYVSLSRKIKDSLSFDVSYEHKGYNYVGGDQNYAEKILKGKLSYSF
ncbi:MAG: hypothetical protein N2606_00085 [Candidatus Omnitrophica bacterium]|nr:hypothetical protein [Candidatus Omnitrophota bacterium]